MKTRMPHGASSSASASDIASSAALDAVYAESPAAASMEPMEETFRMVPDLRERKDGSKACMRYIALKKLVWNCATSSVGLYENKVFGKQLRSYKDWCRRTRALQLDFRGHTQPC